MKKSILFTIPSLGSGGAERGLITLLSLINYKEYDVDLMLFRPEGLFLDQVPPKVNIIDAGDDYKYFDGSLIRSLIYFAKHRKLKLATARIKYMFALKKQESFEKRRLVWKHLSFALPTLEKQYDISIGYLEGNATYYCVDKTNAKNKIGYIHSDYKKLEMDTEFDSKYFEKLNSVVTVSKACAESLIKVIQSVKEKTVVIENIISVAEIKELSISVPVFVCEPDCFKLLTVGRISYEKGIDIAVKACEILVKEGYNICWYIIGSGELKNNIENLVKQKGLERHFFLLGQQENPYKYMAQCDIYVQPSRYEGKSIAIDEVKSLAKPIVTTNFTTVRDQIEDNITGLIAEIDPSSLAEKIKLLIENADIRDSLSENLKCRFTDNANEIEKFYALINNKA